MVKNAIDVIYGGLSYWIYGFGFSFGIANGNNPFCGIGKTKDLARANLVQGLFRYSVTIQLLN